MSTSASLRAELEEAYAALREAATLAYEVDPKLPLPGGWTMREMLAHIAFWLEAAVPVIRYLLRDEPVPPGWQFGSGYIAGDIWPRDTVHNAREAEWARGQPFETILVRWERAHHALLETVDTITEAEASRHGSYYRDIPAHIRHHLAELEAARAGTPGPS